MPRPTGKPLKIAEKVVPGLRETHPSKEETPSPPKGSLSEVEITQTELIERGR